MIIIEKNTVLVKRENVLCINKICASPLGGSPPSFENTQEIETGILCALP